MKVNLLVISCCAGSQRLGIQHRSRVHSDAQGIYNQQVGAYNQGKISSIFLACKRVNRVNLDHRDPLDHSDQLVCPVSTAEWAFQVKLELPETSDLLDRLVRSDRPDLSEWQDQPAPR